MESSDMEFRHGHVGPEFKYTCMKYITWSGNNGNEWQCDIVALGSLSQISGAASFLCLSQFQKRWALASWQEAMYPSGGYLLLSTQTQQFSVYVAMQSSGKCMEYYNIRVSVYVDLFVKEIHIWRWSVLYLLLWVIGVFLPQSSHSFPKLI